MSKLEITLEFGGGAEYLFDKVKKREVKLDGDQKWTIKQLLVWITNNILKERPELFIQDNSVNWETMDPKTRLDDYEKRNIPPVIKKMLEIDVEMTKRFVSFSLNFVPIRSLKAHCKFLEYSCHGVVWLAGWLAFCWLLDNPDMYQMQMNMFLGLILDIIFVAVLKAATRRRRPTLDESVWEIGPDKFSFPSGHASRSFMILMFFVWLDPVSYFFWPPLFAWATSVSLSRILLYRHHILDLLGGILLGVFEALILAVLWLDKDTSLWIMSWISDENLPGSATQEEVF